MIGMRDTGTPVQPPPLMGPHIRIAAQHHCSMKRLGLFLLPIDGMLVHRRVTPALNLPRLKCLAQEHNAVPW